MTWLYWAIITAVFYGLFDFFVKKTAGKLEDGLAAFMINLVSTLVLIVYLVISKYRGVKLFGSNEGFFYSIVAGILIGLASITFIKVFSAGSNLSIGVSIVRIGMVVIGVTLGFLILHEKIELRQLIGMVTALVGLGLILLK